MHIINVHLVICYLNLFYLSSTNQKIKTEKKKFAKFTKTNYIVNRLTNIETLSEKKNKFFDINFLFLD